MPRHPKPAMLRANTERLDVGLIGVSGPDAPPPPPPADLLPITAEAWDAYWRSPLARLVRTATDLLALRRLWRLYDEHERGMSAYGRRRVVEGSTGQLRLNPAKDAVEPGDLLALEDRFGLSPRARLQLGVILGDAHRSLADMAADLERPDDDEPDPRDMADMDGRARRVSPPALRLPAGATP